MYFHSHQSVLKNVKRLKKKTTGEEEEERTPVWKRRKWLFKKFE